MEYYMFLWPLRIRYREYYCFVKLYLPSSFPITVTVLLSWVTNCQSATIIKARLIKAWHSRTIVTCISHSYVQILPALGTINFIMKYDIG